MRYIPHTEEEIATMLDAIGVETIDDLFDSVPDSLKEAAKAMELPAPLSEIGLRSHLSELANKNRVPRRDVTSMLGAGCYDHVVPEALNQLLMRAEFLTSYTPYQAEISQGTTKAIFEFQSMIAELLGMPIANASMYDGAHAAAEAALMAQRTFRRKPRKKVMVAGNVHPEYRQVIKTYLSSQDDAYHEFGTDQETGRFDLDDLRARVDDPKQVACVVFQTPNLLGVIEDPTELIAWAKEHKIVVVATFNEPHAFALTKPPGDFGVDICAGEAMGLGIGQAFGGPALGVFAARKKLLRTMPGRLAGQTVDEQGREGYVLTLSTREQHIRRERATSNICTNQGLMALAAAIYLSLMGKQGFRELARLNMARARHALARFEEKGVGKAAYQAPFFNEFVLELPRPAREVIDACLEEDIIPGFDLGSVSDEWENHLLVAATEMVDKQSIETTVDAVERALAH
jgi:glycine dehydrogenase subunit 1